MKKREILFWAIAALLIFYFFLAFGVFTFLRQEEGQLFIPTWPRLQDQLRQVGGCCAIAGQAIVQYYRMPMVAVAVHTLLALTLGLSVYRLLQGIRRADYNLPLALFPVFIVLKMSVRASYLVDGTITLALMALAALPLLRWRTGRAIALYGVCATLLLYAIAGPLALCFAPLYALATALLHAGDGRRAQGAWSLLPAVACYLLGPRWGVPVSLAEGFRPEEYVEIQALPDAYIYYKVGLLCVALWAGALLASFLLARLDNVSRWRSVGLTAVCLLGAIGLGRYSLPDTLDIQNRMADEVAYLARERQWDALARRFRGKEMRDYISLNYLNMALAQKGQLAESMFTFDQRGTKSLVTPWNQTFFVSKMLCDVHFHIGDLALAESYAMDAMAQAKRGGSAWMLRRLAQINLLRGEWEVARKYIRLLAEMPLYRAWARKAEGYIGHPERMENDPELRGKTLPPARTDNLFGLMTTEALWSSHPAGSIGWEYLGCHYLLAKDLPGFRAFIEASGARELPRHFQEAWLIANDTPDSSALHPAIRPEIARRYEQLRELLSIRSASDVDMRAVYQTFGDTYWFYYYFKIFQDPTNTNAR